MVDMDDESFELSFIPLLLLLFMAVDEAVPMPSVGVCKSLRRDDDELGEVEVDLGPLLFLRWCHDRELFLRSLLLPETNGEDD